MSWASGESIDKKINEVFDAVSKEKCNRLTDYPHYIYASYSHHSITNMNTASDHHTYNSLEDQL